MLGADNHLWSTASKEHYSKYTSSRLPDPGYMNAQRFVLYGRRQTKFLAIGQFKGGLRAVALGVRG